MALFDRAAPPWVRRTLYIFHTLATMARRVAQDPLERDAWRTLFELPQFGVVSPGRIYRAGEPRRAWHVQRLLELGVRTVVCVRGEGPGALLQRVARSGLVALRVFDLGPADQCDRATLLSAARTALAPESQPVLVCCDGGRHRAGMTVACVRLLEGWSLDQALDEYYRFAEPWPFADNVLAIARCAGTQRSATEGCW